MEMHQSENSSQISGAQPSQRTSEKLAPQIRNVDPNVKLSNRTTSENVNNGNFGDNCRTVNSFNGQIKEFQAKIDSIVQNDCDDDDKMIIDVES